MVRPLMTHTPLKSTFLSCEKDAETILRWLFVEKNPHSEMLKRLFVINTKDCLDNLDNEVYNKKVKEMNLAKLIEEKYILLEPKIRLLEHDEIKTYMYLSFDDFVPTDNPEFRDCTVTFDIICHTDYWDLGDYRIRPLKICGYIDGMLNRSRLSGIGTLQFMGCSQLILDDSLSGYTLMYRATHGSDDELPPEELE